MSLSRLDIDRRRPRKRSRDSFPALQHVTQHNAIERFSKLLSTGVHSDVTLVLKNTSISAHKCVLSMGSPVFRAMLGSAFKEAQSNEIQIDDVEPNVMKTVLSYIYTGRLHLLCEESDGKKDSPTDEKQKKERCRKRVRFNVENDDKKEEEEGEGVEPPFPRLVSPPRSPSFYSDQSPGSPKVPAFLLDGDDDDDDGDGVDGSSDASHDFLFQVLLVADRYQIPKLDRLCQVVLCDQLSIKETAKLLLKIQPYLSIESVKAIQSKCIHYCVWQFQKFRTVEGFDAVMDNQSLRNMIFDEMAAQNKVIEKQRRHSQGFNILCHPVYEEDWLSFKVHASPDDSAVVLKAKILDHMNSDYSFPRETISVKCFYDDLQTEELDQDTDASYIKNHSRGEVYVERVL